MPKIIDHDQRRLEIVLATQKLIVAGGFQAATMREIAAAAGYANGALKRYFEGKDEILVATSKHVTGLFIERLMQAVQGLSGMDAVSELFAETMPDQLQNRQTARVLVTFWERAIGNAELSDSFRQELLPWRRLVEKYLREASERGELAGTLSVGAVADELLTQVVGAHVMVQLNPVEENIQGQVENMRRRLASLRAHVPADVNSN